MVKLDNPNLDVNNDTWYHLGLNACDEIKENFSDVTYVCIGGKEKRMQVCAEYLYKQLGQPKSCLFEEDGRTLKNLSGHAQRYAMYKVGPVLIANHGMGQPTTFILLHEIAKLLSYAGCEDVKLFRLGTCGGVGVEPGTVIITDQCYSAFLEPFYTQVAAGKRIQYEARCDVKLGQDLLEVAKENSVNAVIGNTISTDDFYEEQGRVDGAVCSFSASDKMAFLKRAHEDFGVVNMEMEALVISSFCKRVQIKCAVLCVSIVNRLEGDEIRTPKTELTGFDSYPQMIIGNLIRKEAQAQKKC